MLANNQQAPTRPVGGGSPGSSSRRDASEIEGGGGNTLTRHLAFVGISSRSPSSAPPESPKVSMLSTAPTSTSASSMWMGRRVQVRSRLHSLPSRGSQKRARSAREKSQREPTRRVTIGDRPVRARRRRLCAVVARCGAACSAVIQGEGGARIVDMRISVMVRARKVPAGHRRVRNGCCDRRDRARDRPRVAWRIPTVGPDSTRLTLDR